MDFRCMYTTINNPEFLNSMVHNTYLARRRFGIVSYLAGSSTFPRHFVVKPFGTVCISFSSFVSIYNLTISTLLSTNTQTPIYILNIQIPINITNIYKYHEHMSVCVYGKYTHASYKLAVKHFVGISAHLLGREFHENSTRHPHLLDATICRISFMFYLRECFANFLSPAFKLYNIAQALPKK